MWYTNLTLGIAIDICRAFEMTHRQVRNMNQDSLIRKVNVSKTIRKNRKQNKNKVRDHGSQQKQRIKIKRLLWLQTLAR